MITDEIARVRDANRGLLWSHPAVYSTGIGFVPVSGGGEAIGIRIWFVEAELTPREPRLEDVIPDMIGCVNVQLEAGSRPCTAELRLVYGRVVDDQSGAAIKRAYWQSSTEEGVVMVELDEGGDHTGYEIADDNLLKDAASRPSSVNVVTIRVDKEGFQNVERSLRITTDRCGHIQDVEGDTVIRLVRDDSDPRHIVQAPAKPEGLLGSMLGTAGVLRSHTGARLLDGRFLVASGGTGQSMSDTQIYDPHTGTWSSSNSMGQARHYGTATLLSDGRVLVAGGLDRVIALRSAEIYDVSIGA